MNKQKTNNIFDKANKCNKILHLFKIKLLVLLLSTIVCYFTQNITFADNNPSVSPMPTDTRIKTFIYNPNEMFQVKFLVDYQSIIELQKDEKLVLISLGNPAPWIIKSFGRRIFLKATEPGAQTNMTIITDKRTYSLLISSCYSDENDEKVTLIMRFFYPDINIDIPPSASKIAKIALNKKVGNMENSTDAKRFIADSGPINTNYTYATKGNANSIVPIAVFDNGNRTYFKFKKNVSIPTISVLNDEFEEIPLRVRKSGEYVYIDTVDEQLTIRKDNSIVCIFNEKRRNERTIAYFK